ncbi:MAG TPA: hypothetical protein ENN06_09960 [Desulfobacteraceae bacterium]|nr:hypothetical protein [Desulfobacteraceae bacterium]
MPQFTGALKQGLAGLAAYAVLGGGFLLLCVPDKIVSDFQAGEWESLSIRLGLITLASLIVASRLTRPISITTPQAGKGFFLCLIFLGVLFYPLFSQYSQVGKNMKEVAASISSEHDAPGGKILALARTFPEKYEQHAEDHFKLPDAFIQLEAFIKVFGLGISPNTNIAVGKNGFYFEGWGARKVEKGITESFDNIADYMGHIPFSDNELRQWKRVLEERSYWLREQGIDYVFVLAPTKAFVYPEYLPARLQQVKKGVTRYEQLSGFLQNHADVHFVDLLPPLLEAKANRSYPLLFYKTDFHWNFYGAFVVYKAIIDKMSGFFPQYALPRPELDDFELKIDEHWVHERFMYMLGLPPSLYRNEHYITLVPKPGGLYDHALDIPPEGIYDVYPPERPIYAEDGTAMNIPLLLNPKAPIQSILLLGDSFMEKCVYFFSANAQRVLNYRTIVNFPEKIFRHEKPDIVVQEILNMFILRPPPQNPPGLRKSYLRGKFRDCGDNILFRADSEGFVEKRQDGRSYWEVTLPDMKPMKAEEVRLVKLELHGNGPGKAAIGFMGSDGRQLAKSVHDITPGHNVLFLEAPMEPAASMTISLVQKEDALDFRSIEVRSDLDI